MAEDWAIDVKKYVPDADDGVIAAIVRYLGIALHNRDSSLVAYSDQTELDRVRESFLKKKLALTDPDSTLNAAIAEVGERMKADRTKNRVTVYYLLAERFRKLHLFGGTDRVVAAAPIEAPVRRPEPIIEPKAAPVVEPVVEPAVERFVAPPPRRTPEPMVAAAAPAAFAAGYAAERPREREGTGLGWLPWVLGLLALAALALFFLFGRRAPAPVAEAPTATLAAPRVTAPPAAPPVAPAAPVVTAPSLAAAGPSEARVHFANASATLSAADRAMIRTAASAAKADGGTLAVTGYTDNVGQLSSNQALASRRAAAVRAALIADGVPADRIDMQPPATVEVGAGPGPDGDARRVDIVRR